MTELPSPRRLACARCGAAFECGLNAQCWCRAEPYRLPMSNTTGEDCLCQACLRKAALAAGLCHHPDTM